MPPALTTVAWREWGDAAFEEAAAGVKPILLVLTATWSHWCHEMDRRAYADPAIASLVNDRFVPIRVDTDLRPDINERYNLGGWPTTAFLTPAGDILGGGTYVAAERLPDVLRRVSEAFRERGADLRRSTPETMGRTDREVEPRIDDPAAIAAWFSSRLLELFDAEHGGFGTEPKFPHFDAVRFALERCRADGDERFRTMVVGCLDALGWAGLFDEVDGGVFRYSTTCDWTLPHTEKLLEEQAGFVQLYLDAWRVLQEERYLGRVADVIRYVQRTLAQSDPPCFHASQRAGTAYYRLDHAHRARTSPPAVDRTEYTGTGALMAGACFRAAIALQDYALADFAARALDRLVLAAYEPGSGVAHCMAPGREVRGLLADQVQTTAALLDAHAASGQLPYLELAQEIGLSCLERLWDPPAGGLFDRCHAQAADHGLLRSRIKPFASNAQAARVFLRLATATGEALYATRAGDILRVFAPQARQMDLAAAPYALAVLDWQLFGR
jgi:uncharacterized protein YyaL (SSP411 family)